MASLDFVGFAIYVFEELHHAESNFGIVDSHFSVVLLKCVFIRTSPCPDFVGKSLSF